MRKVRFKKFSPRYVFDKRRRFLHIKNHPFVVPIVTLLVLLAITGIVFIFLGSKTVDSGDAHVVIVSYDNQKQTVPTTAANVGDLLKRLDIKLHEGDIVEPEATTPIVEDNYRINVYRAKPVTIDDGTHKIFAYSAATTPRSVAAQAGIQVYPEDEITSHIPDKFLPTANIGEQLTINRSVPVNLVLYGSPIGSRTHSTTVRKLIEEKGISLSEGDKVLPGLDAKIKKGMFIVISRKGTEFSITTESVEPPTQIVQDATLSFGTTAVRQKGSAGKTVTVYQVIRKNGKVVGRKKVQQVIIEKPVPQVVARGKLIDIAKDKTGAMAAAGISSSDYGFVNYVISRESNWHLDARNAGGCLGLGQRCPGSILIDACPLWQTDAVCQLKHFTAYANSHHGGWGGAYNFWIANHYW